MSFRIGAGKKIGGVYIGVSKTIGSGNKKGKNNGGGGCWTLGLAILFFPITLIYLFAKWAYTKTQQQKATNPDKVWYKQTWGIILMLILFFPVGIYLMWKYGKHWNLYAKIAVCIVFGVFFIVGIASNDKKEELDNESSVEQIVSTQKTTEQETEIKETEFKNEDSTVPPATEPPTEPETESETVEAIADQEEVYEESEEVIEEEPIIEEPVEEESVAEENPDDYVTVYYTKTGEKYHYENPCGRGTYYECTLSEAKSRGLTPCEKCVLH